MRLSCMNQFKDCIHENYCIYLVFLSVFLVLVVDGILREDLFLLILNEQIYILDTMAFVKEN